MNVTVRQLIALGACDSQVELCAAMWGSGPIEVNADACECAAALGLDADWAADNLLPAGKRDDYEAKRKSLDDYYEAKRKSLDDDDYYEAKRKSLDDDDYYEAKCKPLYDDYLAKRWQVFAALAGEAV
jgi:hypothetical protein